MSDVNQKTSRQTELNNYKIPGMRTPRNRQETEKPKEGRKTAKRLFMYFTGEKYMLLGLLLSVSVVVICSVYAPALQSRAIDRIS